MFFDAREGVTMLHGESPLASPCQNRFASDRETMFVGLKLTMLRYIAVSQVSGRTAVTVPDRNDSRIFKITESSCQKAF